MAAQTLTGRRILLGVTGGIAVYKAVELLRRLQKAGAAVHVMMTRAAQQFVAPLTFQALSGAPVATELFDLDQESRIGHIELGRSVDCALVAPATANFIAKLSWGLADDLPSTSVLACPAPLVIAPAMNVNMWQSAATQENVARLAARPGVSVVQPGEGMLACGDEGAGRLAPLDDIVEAVHRAIGPRDLEGRHVVVSSGPTREAIDPVRFLSNRSTGRMGHAVARVAWRRGARVTLVTGPVHLPDPPGVETRHVESALEMRAALLEATADADALVMAAAVGDLRPATPAIQKLHKGEIGEELRLERNPDLIEELGRLDRPRLRVGFAAETRDELESGHAKLRRKGCHLMAVNRVDSSDAGFGALTNRIVLLDQMGGEDALPLEHKELVAWRLLDRVRALLDAEPGRRSEEDPQHV